MNKPKTKCALCGKSFLAKKKNAKFCCKKCKDLSYRKNKNANIKAKATKGKKCSCDTACKKASAPAIKGVAVEKISIPKKNNCKSTPQRKTQLCKKDVASLAMYLCELLSEVYAVGRALDFIFTNNARKH